MKMMKSLADLELVADELLAKSTKAEDNQEDELKPDDISSDSVTPADAESSDSMEAEDKKDIEKSEDTEEVTEEDSDNSDEEVEEDTEVDAEEIEKSLKDDFESHEDIQKGIESSEFLSAVVEVLTKSMSDIQYDVIQGNKSERTATDVLAKSLHATLASNAQLQKENERLTRTVVKLEKSMSKGFTQIMDALDEISTQPATMRKSMVSVHDRDFGSSVNGAKQSTGYESLSKSQIMSVLNSEFQSGSNTVTVNDIISYESGAPLRQDLQMLVASKFK